MMNLKQREYFEELLSLLHFSFSEFWGTDAEYTIGGMMINIHRIAEKYCGADKFEMLAISHNAHCRYSGLSRIEDIDKYVNEMKLDEEIYSILINKNKKVE